MTGEQLYAHYTEQLRDGWQQADRALIFATRPSQPERLPVTWAFLTGLEQHAWERVAADLDVGQQLEAAAKVRHDREMADMHRAAGVQAAGGSAYGPSPQRCRNTTVASVRSTTPAE